MFLPIVVDEKIANEILHALFNNLQKEAIIKLLKNLYADSTALSINPNKWYRESSDIASNLSAVSGVGSVTIGTSSTVLSVTSYSFSAASQVGGISGSSFSALLASSSSSINLGGNNAVLGSTGSSISSGSLSAIVSSSAASIVSSAGCLVAASSSSSSVANSTNSIVEGSQSSGVVSSSESSVASSSASSVFSSSRSGIGQSLNGVVSLSQSSALIGSSSSQIGSSDQSLNMGTDNASVLNGTRSGAILSSASSNFGSTESVVAQSTLCDIWGAARTSVISSRMSSLTSTSQVRQISEISCDDVKFNTSHPNAVFENSAFIAAGQIAITNTTLSYSRGISIISSFFNNTSLSNIFDSCLELAIISSEEPNTNLAAFQRSLIAASRLYSGANCTNAAIVSSRNTNAENSTRFLVSASDGCQVLRANDSAVLAATSSAITSPSFSIFNNLIAAGSNSTIEGSNRCAIIGSANYILGSDNIAIIGNESNTANNPTNSVAIGNNASVNRNHSVFTGFNTTRTGPAAGKVQKIEYADSIVTNSAGTFVLPVPYQLSAPVAQGGSHVMWHVEVVVNAISSDGLNSASFVRRRLYRRQFLPVPGSITPIDAVLNVSQRGSAANNPPAGWAATINHDVPTNSLRIEVTAPAGVTIYWDAFVTIYQTVLP